MCWCTESGSYLRLIDPCITQLKAQGPARTCNESKEEEEERRAVIGPALGVRGDLGAFGDFGAFGDLGALAAGLLAGVFLGAGLLLLAGDLPLSEGEVER